MTTITFQMLIDYLNDLYPPHLAEDWDQVGLHFGNPQAPVKRILTTLDVRDAVVDEAIEQGIDTIVVHHPILFHGIKRFDLSDAQTQVYAKLIKHDIKVFAMHTNHDIQWNGMNDWLCEELGLENIRPLERPEDLDNPGLGRIGELPQPVSRDTLLELLKATYGRTQFPVIETTPKAMYQRIALIGGAGSSYAHLAAKLEADVYLTGDITYHAAQACEQLPLMTVDVGHYTEVIFAKKMAALLNDAAEQKQWKIEAKPTTININPFKYE
ncbi:Nif3-like dinuclear metal center hexameric protein [Aerococcaceae bacterium zg-ZUI334]|uniref:Nif3-like dinuclear metal center hexameric protein n=1 Tax=Aerococcaceae bacterium zg-252 TaxID=2796928 RepID=UPI001B919D7A|nr:Nif3-like dinuclear metal center hexameric protein [Aerococcaceae bacterium zg-ZUI334]